MLMEAIASVHCILICSLTRFVVVVFGWSSYTFIVFTSNYMYVNVGGRNPSLVKSALQI